MNMFRTRLTNLFTAQRGFSFPELLVAVSLMGVLGTATAGLVYQMTQVATHGVNRMAMQADLRTSMQWLARDTRMAHATSLVDDGAAVSSCTALAPNPCVTLTWTNEYAGASTDHAVAYALVGTELRRTHNGATHVVARNVTGMTASLLTRRVAITLTSTSEGVSDSVSHYFFLTSLAGS